QKHIMELESEGIRVAWFDSAGNFGYEEMFERLKDQSFLKKFRDGIREHKKILIVEDRDGRVMGTAGTVYPEKNGRGFFSALAVDPADGGRGIGNVLFFSLCQELKNMGAEYMTIFVTETNFARRIYEKAGFSAVQEWAILKKTV
ncbi:GNAT family N-acetyltransferase, partial [Enterocloster bolteae]